ncbi:integrating conjugative element protein [Pseudomonas sp.]|uniref:integrating conjugative element protein n=1 Tax=Pseudomonas sp. TaxID=306 RepID=UPI002610349D|nr:integrating conjugative element protein [Pseudomonas sp.]
MNRLVYLVLLLGLTQSAQASSLIVVEDRGGVSALPYYQDLAPEPADRLPPPPSIGIRDAGAFPVRSALLSPGQEQGRVINAPGLQPMFLVGDDEQSKAWLLQRRELLQQLNAVGLVTNVASAERLAEVQRWAEGLQIAPVQADDLAQRLGIRHYPLLITATTLQQ